jgi:sec-independent protein translocase protein TatC
LSTATTERKSFFRRIRGKNAEEPAEMSFFDHIEVLRWHIIRCVAAWLIAALAIFIYRDWVYDNIILAPANDKFVTYGALCRFGQWLHLGDSFCMPPVVINFQITTVNGTFTSALNIAFIGGIIFSFPYIFWEVWRFIKPLSAPKRENMPPAVFCMYRFVFLPAYCLVITCWPLLLLIFWPVLHWALPVWYNTSPLSMTI